MGDAESQREELILSVPELRARMLDDLAGTFREVAQVLAARVGRSPDELPVRASAGAVIGAGIAVWLTSAEGIATADYIEQFDAAMACLDTGLSL